MHFLYLTAHTPVGVFTGKFNLQAGPEAELTALRDKMQLSGLNRATIYSTTGDGIIQEITFTEQVLSQSVLVYEIRPAG